MPDLELYTTASCPLPTEGRFSVMYLDVCWQRPCSEHENWTMPRVDREPISDVVLLHVTESIQVFEVRCVNMDPFAVTPPRAVWGQGLSAPGVPLFLPEPPVAFGLLAGALLLAWLWRRR